MTITTYNTVLNEDRHNYLVKDKTFQYDVCKRLETDESIVHLMCDVFGIQDAAEEYLYMISVNAKCVPLAFFQLAHGTVSLCYVGIREIMIRNLLCGASAFVLIHNHPSGAIEPSDEDKRVTKRVMKAAELMGIELLDHIIIGSRDAYYSIRKEFMR